LEYAPTSVLLRIVRTPVCGSLPGSLNLPERISRTHSWLLHRLSGKKYRVVHPTPLPPETDVPWPGSFFGSSQMPVCVRTLDFRGHSPYGVHVSARMQTSIFS